MTRSIKKAAIGLALGTIFVTSGAIASAGSEAISQAETDLKTAQASGAVWRLVDPATGGKAVPLQKLIKTAKTKLEAGDEAEAIRIAEKVSWAADMGLSQAQDQVTAKPYY
ncbi:MAG: hypothetical protein HOG18_10535 [Proteobacteria bacterium]|nr:hypothetical protein [Pseudomonadota bacterium]MBT4988154.1 hypothetical protein [Pseudomonadota bacterium]MBT6932693.1 hypothetical protein [Pseudomonadota bacterium]